MDLAVGHACPPFRLHEPPRRCYDGSMKSPTEPTIAHDLLGSALLGAATGMRSTVGLASVLVEGDTDGLPAALQHPVAKPAAGVAVAIELVLDKMPFTGSRLEPAGIGGRLVFAGAAAGLAARRRARPVVASVLIAVAAAGVTAKVAHDLRARLAKKMPDRAVAVVEDLAALAVAAAAGRW